MAETPEEWLGEKRHLGLRDAVEWSPGGSERAVRIDN